MMAQQFIRQSKERDKMILRAIAAGRKTIWKDSNGFWHAATDSRNVPSYAVETYEVQP